MPNLQIGTNTGQSWPELTPEDAAIPIVVRLQGDAEPTTLTVGEFIAREKATGRTLIPYQFNDDLKWMSPGEFTRAFVANVKKQATRNRSQD